MNDEQIARYGIDVYRLYDAHRFDFERETLTPTNIEATWRAKHGWVPPSELKAVS